MLNIFTDKKIIAYLCLPCVLINNHIMQQGTVKFFNETKGFGFITPSNGGSEIFVHSSGLIDNIRENNVVSFDVEEGRKGPNAVNVKVA
jgi:CspA family cold shock protein